MTRRRALPPPLVPPDLDLGGMKSFQLNTERLLHSDLAVLASGDEFRAAVLLWCRAWLQSPPASLPDDDRILASYAGMTFERWQQSRAMVLRGWRVCSDGRLYHPLLADDAIRAAKKVRFRSAVGKKGAAARWKDHQHKGKSAQVRDAVGIADGMPQAKPANGQWQRQLQGGEPPAAAAGVAPPSKAGATAPSTTPDGGAPGPGGPAPRAAAAASKPNPDANGKIRAMLGKLGMPASPQAAAEWEGFFKANRLTEVATARSFLTFCARKGDVPYPRFVTAELVLEWRGTPT